MINLALLNGIALLSTLTSLLFLGYQIYHSPGKTGKITLMVGCAFILAGLVFTGWTFVSTSSIASAVWSLFLVQLLQVWIPNIIGPTQ